MRPLLVLCRCMTRAFKSDGLLREVGKAETEGGKQSVLG